MRKTILTVLAALAILTAAAVAGPYEDGDAAYTKGDYATALRLYRPLADQGYAPAQWSVGVIYAAGQGVPQDWAEAAKWYRKAAEQGQANAQYSLGNLYDAGRGVLQDYVQAHMWFNLAAVHYPAAQATDRAEAVAKRDQVAAKMTTAQVADAQRLAAAWKPVVAAPAVAGAAVQPLDIELYAQADAVNVRAQPTTGAEVVAKLSKGDVVTVTGTVGDWYQTQGSGRRTGYVLSTLLGPKPAQAVPPRLTPFAAAEAAYDRNDYAAALKQFRTLADAGNDLAQLRLASMYAEGEGLEPDYAEAAQWYRRAAEQGNPYGQYQLATMYSAGLGVPEDNLQAYLWASLAAARLSESYVRDDALAYRDAAAETMTPAQIAEAQRLAAAWKPKTP